MGFAMLIGVSACLLSFLNENVTDFGRTRTSGFVVLETTIAELISALLVCLGQINKYDF